MIKESVSHIAINAAYVSSLSYKSHSGNIAVLLLKIFQISSLYEHAIVYPTC